MTKMSSVVDMKDLTDSREVMTRHAPKVMPIFIYTLIALLVIALAWSFIGQMDTFVTAAGEIRPEEFVGTLAVSASGRIENMHFQDGELVQADDIILELDTATLLSQAEILVNQIEAATENLANQERLRQSVMLGENLFSRTEPGESAFYFQFEAFMANMDAQLRQIIDSDGRVTTSRLEFEQATQARQTQINELEIWLEDYDTMLRLVNMDNLNSNAARQARASLRPPAQLLFDNYRNNHERARLVATNTTEIRSLQQSIASLQNQLTQAQDIQRGFQDLQELIGLHTNSIAAQLIRNRLSPQMRTLYQNYNDNMERARLTYEQARGIYEALREQISTPDSLLDEARFAMEIARANQNAVRSSFLVEINAQLQLQNNNVNTLQAQLQTQQAQLERAIAAMRAAQLETQTLQSSFLVEISSLQQRAESDLNTLRTQLAIDEIQLNALDFGLTEEEAVEQLRAVKYVEIEMALDALNRELDSLQNQMLTTTQAKDNAIVRAQMDGILVLNGDLVAGNMLGAGTSIGTIMPTTEQLRVQLFIPEANIAEIAVGQRVEYIVSSISFAEYGRASGTIVSISADSLADESGLRFFRAEATLDTSTLTNRRGETRTLQPGMLVEARAISGSQRIIYWLLDMINLRG